MKPSMTFQCLRCGVVTMQLLWNRFHGGWLCRDCSRFETHVDQKTVYHAQEYDDHLRMGQNPSTPFPSPRLKGTTFRGRRVA